MLLMFIPFSYIHLRINSTFFCLIFDLIIDLLIRNPVPHIELVSKFVDVVDGNQAARAQSL